MTITKIKRIGQKSAWIETHEADDRQPVKVLKSYATRVAFAAGLDGYISKRYYSRTTSRHISCFTREYPGVTWHEADHRDFSEKLFQAIG